MVITIHSSKSGLVAFRGRDVAIAGTIVVVVVMVVQVVLQARGRRGRRGHAEGHHRAVGLLLGLLLDHEVAGGPDADGGRELLRVAASDVAVEVVVREAAEAVDIMVGHEVEVDGAAVGRSLVVAVVAVVAAHVVDVVHEGGAAVGDPGGGGAAIDIVPVLVLVLTQQHD